MFPQIIKVVEREKEADAFETATNIYEASITTDWQTLFRVLETQH